ncbi:MAG: hypothetical protein Q9187_001640 [Circinaria calcarea]
MASVELPGEHGPHPKVPRVPPVGKAKTKAWVSPFAPNGSEAWPHSRTKTYWIGPFDLQQDLDAKAASEDTSRESARLRGLRDLAEIHQSDGNYTGARFCLAKIAEHYISARAHVIVEVHRAQILHQTRFLHHKIKTAIGGIINTFFLQFPDFSTVADERGQDHLSYFDKVVEKEGGYGDPEALYTTRVILCYCSQVPIFRDGYWLCKLHRQVLSIAEPVYGSNHPDIIHLLRGTAQAIQTQEIQRARDYSHARRIDRRRAWDYRTLSMAPWKYEAAVLQLRALSGLVYATRVIFCYFSQVLQNLNLNWLWKLQRQVLNIAEPVYGSNHPDIIHLLRGIAKAIQTQEIQRARDYSHARRIDRRKAWDYRIQNMTSWKYKAAALLLRALSGLLYITRVILCYCSQVLQDCDLDWLCKLQKQVLSIAEPVYGSNHPDIIHLLRGTAQAIEKQEKLKATDYIDARRMDWMQAWNCRTQSVTPWTHEAAALLLRALSGLQELHGCSSPSSMDCAYELAMLYKRTHELDKAESTLREMYETAKRVFGEEHDHTIWFLAVLSKTIMREKPEDAGLMVYQYITKHRQAICETSVNDLERAPEVEGKYTPGRGWRDMVRLNDDLSRHLTPYDLRWADYYLYTLSIGDVELLPVSPSEDEKKEAWNHSKEVSLLAKGQAERYNPNLEPEAFKFRSLVQDDLSVNLQVPYISYTHFRSTRSFRYKEPYLEYVKASEDRSIDFSFDDEPSRILPSKCTNLRRTFVSENLGQNDGEFGLTSYPALSYDALSCVFETGGFFNGIPADSALLHSNEPEPMYNLVSSKWADWQQFTLHTLPKGFSLPQLSNGTEVKCHGYISGTWTDKDLSCQRKVFKLVVVDAVFSSSAATDASTHLFALSTEALESSERLQLTGLDKRAFCGRLNPSLYVLARRFVDVQFACCSMEMEGSTVKSASEGETDLWNEMNRREQWDRDFERREPALFTYEADQDELKQALNEEDKYRLLWDERFQNQQSASPTQETVGSSSVAPADASAEAGTNASANGNPNHTDTTSKSSRRFGKSLKNKLRFLF